jgi:L-seryl-tRNA(Ser) seleniumtransferase
MSRLLGTDAFAQLAGEYGPGLAKFQLREVLGACRAAVLAATRAEVPTVDALMAETRTQLLRVARPAGRDAINATGILLHTGLGRAPMCREAVDALARFDHYSLLQTDLADGGRGLREEKVERLLAAITGCEAVCVVNNNAAATMLVLTVLAAGREVVISRGQLVEIGGSFRIPDVMAASGALLREVGTTNRTHVRDYEAAIVDGRTAAILRVHTSNYRIRGFVAAPELTELVALAHSRGLPVIDDLGSGALVSLQRFGLPDEPLVQDSIAAGVDVCCFSGDKLISGPQAGIIAGKRSVIERMRKHPFARIARVCKMTLAALEATLCHFLDGASLWSAIPLYQMLGRAPDDLQRQAETLQARIGVVAGTDVQIVAHESFIGSGSLPDRGLPSRALSLGHAALGSHELSRRLRTSFPSVLGHIAGGTLLLDMRTVQPNEVDTLARVVREALAAPERQAP